MDTKVKGDVIEIGISKLFDGMDADALLDLAQSISCERGVFEAVCDQLIEGLTENGSNVYQDSIDKCRLKLLKSIRGVAFEVVKELKREAAQAKQDEKQGSDWAWRLYHAWPDAFLCVRPDWPHHIPAPRASDEEVGAVADEIVKGVDTRGH